ncbi:PAS domain S-box protein [Halobacillus locisalis]|uniref:histidine kinase n=2 Tax=Halobacillus locisalis TaxID=220753 RepID=A0A838CS81_9BACI|nr:PAS domain S-box protein [Halobacillus locisalis]
MNDKAKQLLERHTTECVHIDDLFLDLTLEDLQNCDRDVLLQHYLKPQSGDPYPVFIVVHKWKEEAGQWFITIQNLVERSLLDRHAYEPLKELLEIKYALDESSIVALTNQRGIIQYANRKFCEISKYPIEEIIGSDHRLINSGHHSREFFKQLWRTIGSGQVWKGEIKNRAKDGSYYWVDTTIVPFIDQQGKPYQYLAIRSEITERKRVEEELQKMMTRFIHVQEEERKQVSRELHDGIGQELYSLLISMHRLQQEVEHPILEQLEADTSRLIQSVREMSWELRPSALDELGLMPALRSFINRLENSYGFVVHIEAHIPNKLSPELETTIYRVVQEAITNVRKYAGVKEADVHIYEVEGSVVASVEDHGVGIRERDKQKGVGLFSMEERARSVGGSFRLSSPPRGGTKVEIQVPLEA